MRMASDDHGKHEPVRRVAVCRKLPGGIFCGMYGDEHVVWRKALGVMAENSPPAVRIVSYADFARGNPTRIVSRDMTAAGRDLAVQRALSRVGEHGYSLTGWNCEHFATWCATGIAASQQVIDWSAALARILAAAMFSAAAAEQ